MLELILVKQRNRLNLDPDHRQNLDPDHRLNHAHVSPSH